MSEPDDIKLMERCSNGDRHAFELLLARYEKPVFNAAYRMLNSPDDARDVMAAGLGCRPGEVVFTGGGTEADNLAIFGVVEARPDVVQGVACPEVRVLVAEAAEVGVRVFAGGIFDG